MVNKLFFATMPFSFSHLLVYHKHYTRTILSISNLQCDNDIERIDKSRKGNDEDVMPLSKNKMKTKIFARTNGQTFYKLFIYLNLNLIESFFFILLTLSSLLNRYTVIGTSTFNRSASSTIASKYSLLITSKSGSLSAS